jgi:hypothetical protein
MNKNDLVSRFREKTDKHWHPFMGVDTTIEKKADMAVMTEEDHYEIKVYPKGNRIVLRFVGDCWDKYNYEMTYNSYVAPLVRRYSQDWMTWDTRKTIAEGHYEFSWPARVLDIKGDG